MGYEPLMMERAYLESIFHFQLPALRARSDGGRGGEERGGEVVAVEG